MSSGLQLQAVQEEAAPTLPRPGLVLHALPGRQEHHDVPIPHPPSSAELLRQVRGADFPRVSLSPQSLRRRLTLPGRGHALPGREHRAQRGRRGAQQWRLWGRGS